MQAAEMCSAENGKHAHWRESILFAMTASWGQLSGKLEIFAPELALSRFQLLTSGIR